MMILQTHDHGPQCARIRHTNEPSDLRSHSGAQIIHFTTLCINMHIFRSIFQIVAALTMTGMWRGGM